MHLNWTESVRNFTASHAGLSARLQGFGGGHDDDEHSVLYIVAFGILANAVIAAACMTTLAFVRGSKRSSPPPKQQQQLSSAVEPLAVPPTATATAKEIPSDVYKLLSKATPPPAPHHARNATQQLPSIPELYASRNVDVQAMMISSTSLSHFFGKQQQHLPAQQQQLPPVQKKCVQQQQRGIQWSMA